MIFFDLDGTLLDHEHAEREAVLRFWEAWRGLIDEPAPAFLKRWQAAARFHRRRYQAGEVDFIGQRRDRIREVLRKTQMDDNVADAFFAKYSADYERHWRLFGDVEDCLKRLAGLALGIITNGDPGQQRAKLKQLGLEHAFAVVVCSGEVGSRKPDPSIFYEACSLAGEAPSACMHIGDDLEADAQAASKAGLQSIWLRRKAEQTGEHILTIQSLDQFKPCLDSVLR